MRCGRRALGGARVPPLPVAGVSPVLSNAVACPWRAMARGTCAACPVPRAYGACGASTGALGAGTVRSPRRGAWCRGHTAAVEACRCGGGPVCAWRDRRALASARTISLWWAVGPSCRRGPWRGGLWPWCRRGHGVVLRSGSPARGGGRQAGGGGLLALRAGGGGGPGRGERSRAVSRRTQAGREWPHGGTTGVV